MKLVLGLGNPGPEYAETRHNVGWWVLDACHHRWGGGTWKRDGDALVAEHRLGTARVRLCKPLTFMNLSGRVLGQYLRRPLWRPEEDLLVVVDEVALPLAQLRLRPSGSAGGHNGLKDVERMLGHQRYPRLRVGIRPEDERRLRGDLADFVLDRFGRDEAEVVRDALPRLVDAVECWVHDGTAAAMNRFN